MRYRIKITTFKNGRKEFKAQVKKWWGWTGIMSGGEEFFDASSVNTRSCALYRIDKHYEGNTKPQTIEFEYIDK